MADQISTAAQTNSQSTITLSCCDGRIFTIPIAAAVQAKTLRNLVESGFHSGVLPLIKGATFAKIVTYLNKQMEDGLSDKFKEEFFDGLHFWVLQDILLAANFLDIQDLIDLTCKKIASIMVNKSPEWVRNAFMIVNDFEPEEEAELRSQHYWTFEDVDGDDGEDYFTEETLKKMSLE